MLNSTRLLHPATTAARAVRSPKIITVLSRGLARESRASTPSPEPEGAVTKESNTLRADASRTGIGKRKTVLEADEELMEKLEDMSGEGGVAGLELEDGKPTAMKRGVRDNMFRVI